MNSIQFGAVQHVTVRHENGRQATDRQVGELRALLYRENGQRLEVMRHHTNYGTSDLYWLNDKGSPDAAQYAERSGELGRRSSRLAGGGRWIGGHSGLLPDLVRALKRPFIAANRKKLDALKAEYADKATPVTYTIWVDGNEEVIGYSRH